MKVSFDFDSTLDRPSVQDFAKKLVNDGIEVWIVTSRISIEYAKSNLDEFSLSRINKSNNELFRVADKIGIKSEHIHFTNTQFKSDFLSNKNFIFHLDDDSDELIAILESGDSCKPVNVCHFDWERDCKLYIKQNT